MGKVIGVVSLKGGVGKTSVVATLGAALASLGKKVLLVDGNLSSPTLGLHLNIVNPEKTLNQVLTRTANPKEAIYSSEGFDVMPSSVFSKTNDGTLKLKDKLKGIKRGYDAVILDSAPSLGDETLGVILASDELLAVTTPDRPTLSSTMKAIKLAQQRGVPIAGLILNKVHKKNFEIPLEDIEETLHIPVLAVIPYDIKMLKALANMRPYNSHSPNSEGSEEFRKLAATIMGEKYKPAALRRLFSWISPSKQEINRELFYKSVFEK